MLAFVPSRRYKSYTLGLWDYVQYIKNSGEKKKKNSDPHVWTNHFYSSVKVTSALYGSAPHIKKKKKKSRIVFSPYVVYILRRIRVPRPVEKMEKDFKKVWKQHILPSVYGLQQKKVLAPWCSVVLYTFVKTKQSLVVLKGAESTPGPVCCVRAPCDITWGWFSESHKTGQDAFFSIPGEFTARLENMTWVTFV